MPITIVDILDPDDLAELPHDEELKALGLPTGGRLPTMDEQEEASALRRERRLQLATLFENVNRAGSDNE